MGGFLGIFVLVVVVKRYIWFLYLINKFKLEIVYDIFSKKVFLLILG